MLAMSCILLFIIHVCVLPMAVFNLCMCNTTLAMTQIELPL